MTVWTTNSLWLSLCVLILVQHADSDLYRVVDLYKTRDDLHRGHDENLYKESCEIIRFRVCKFVKRVELLNKHRLYRPNGNSVHSVNPLSSVALGQGDSYLMYAQGMKIMSVPFRPSTDNPGQQIVYIPGKDVFWGLFIINYTCSPFGVNVNVNCQITILNVLNRLPW